MRAIQFEDLLNPETILPVQFQHMWGETREVTPERALFVAVLWQAIDDLRTYQHGRYLKGRHVYRTAYQWVASDDRSWPCSFLNVCDVLGLSPGALRAGLLGTRSAVAA
jgi:hypothetical protein